MQGQALLRVGLGLEADADHLRLARGVARLGVLALQHGGGADARLRLIEQAGEQGDGALVADGEPLVLLERAGEAAGELLRGNVEVIGEEGGEGDERVEIGHGLGVDRDHEGLAAEEAA